MRERAILFSGEMVRAILEGRKTQTRRPMKPQPVERLTRSGESKVWGWPPGLQFTSSRSVWRKKAPHHVGDVLWVREAWRIGTWNEDQGAVALDYRADGHCRREWLTVPDEEQFERLWIQSCEDCEHAGIQPQPPDDRYHWEPGESPCRWRPSILMPRWAARLLLEVTDVRVERVGDISGDDVEAEGIAVAPHLPLVTPFSLSAAEQLITRIAQGLYAPVWDAIYGDKPGLEWDANPWVWVVTFRRVTAEHEVS